MTPAEIQAKIDSQIDTTKLQAFATKQQSWITAHQEYFQGIQTPFPIPVDGVDQPIDLTVHPTDRPYSWQDFLPANITITQLACTLSITFHNTPSGVGFTVYEAFQTIDNHLWMKATGVGPGSATFAWKQVS